jgi:hypothetical protein
MLATLSINTGNALRATTFLLAIDDGFFIQGQQHEAYHRIGLLKDALEHYKQHVAKQHLLLFDENTRPEIILYNLEWLVLHINPVVELMTPKSIETLTAYLDDVDAPLPKMTLDE